MYKQIILCAVIFVSTSCSTYGQKTPVFENEKQVGYMNEESNYDCNNCYFMHSIVVLKKILLIKEPVYIQDRVKKDSVHSYIVNEYSTEITNLNKTTSIIKFNSTSNGSSYWLYISIRNGLLFIVKQLSYANAITNEEPSTKVCVKKINKRINKKIDFYDFFENKDVNQNCHFCPVTVSIEECIRLSK
ncbi:hypothetical protein HNQ02_003724 [Flavobacterium sp. 7E]|uniref:hypothetical protein n=1 Tax=Flavobacterium sp. 7E TaxID=2735898 RepID=UPI00157064BA|nr:hypothetical protein [Flavobacterium sp. 7E]NRS90777.1 hypothetical protein [Flavobacterium sp. 7E]